MQLTPGDRIDRYQLIEPLGEGGQGSVWKAVDALDPSRVVALKLVPILHAKPNQLERVRREARGLAKLDHPSLVKCHGLFEDFKLSVLGLVLDVVDGVSLADALDDARLVPRLRWAILEHLGRALAHLHAHRIIHRDLKPENIVLAHAFWSAPNDPSTVKVIDFGIAIEEGDPSRLTSYGNVIGTPAYMAPELIDATRLKSAPLTPAIDVFAFGVVAWRLLNGDHPTGLPPDATLLDYAVEYRRISLGHRTWVAPIADLPDVVTACIETDPHRRLQSGVQIVETLTGGLARPTPAVVPASSPRTVQSAPPTGFYQSAHASTRTATVVERPVVPHGSRSRWLVSTLLALGALASVAILAAAAIGWWALHDNEPLPPESLPPSAATTTTRAATPAPTPVACTDCSHPGTTCESGKCRLAPGSRWSVRPFALVRKPVQGGVDQHSFSLCVRPTGIGEPACSEGRSVFTPKIGGGDIAYFSRRTSVVLTRSQIEEEGIDIEVRRNGLTLWHAERRTPKDNALVAGSRLFDGGLKFGIATAELQDAFVALKYAGKE